MTQPVTGPWPQPGDEAASVGLLVLRMPGPVAGVLQTPAIPLKVLCWLLCVWKSLAPIPIHSISLVSGYTKLNGFRSSQTESDPPLAGFCQRRSDLGIDLVHLLGVQKIGSGGFQFRQNPALIHGGWLARRKHTTPVASGFGNFTLGPTRTDPTYQDVDLEITHERVAIYQLQSQGVIQTIE